MKNTLFLRKYHQKGKDILSKMKMYGLWVHGYNLIYSSKIKHVYNLIKRTGKVKLPKLLFLEPTQRCNLRCKQCFYNRSLTVKPNELTLNEIKKTLNQLPTIEKIRLIGGEIFVRGDISDIFDLINDMGIKFEFTTNGVLINKNNIQRLYKNNNLTDIVFSVDGLKKVHDSIRGMNNAFDKTINAMKLVNKKIPTHMLTVIMKENIYQLPKLLEFSNKMSMKSMIYELARKYTMDEINDSCKLLGVSQDSIPLSISNNGEFGFSMRTLKEIICDIEKIKKNFNTRVHYYPPYLHKRLVECYHKNLREREKYICSLLLCGRIDPQGNVIHCYAVRESFGNVLEKSFEEIWNSEKMKNFRKNLLNNNLLPICETCLYMSRVN